MLQAVSYGLMQDYGNKIRPDHGALVKLFQRGSYSRAKMMILARGGFYETVLGMSSH